MSEHDIPVIPVIATRAASGQWRLTYRDKCPSGQRHFHGGGTSDEPFLGDGIWISHCAAPGYDRQVRLVVVES